MRSLSIVGAGAVLGVVGLFLVGCPAVADGLCARNVCDDDAAATDGPGPDAVATDPCLENPSDPKCLEESSAVFVSNPKGDDTTADGTKGKPFKTIGAALDKLTPEKKRVYVCEGIYAEAPVLTTRQNGASLFGGVNCDWAPNPTIKPIVQTALIPFKVSGAQGIAIAQMAFEANDASNGSSVALFVANATLVLKDVRIKAGRAGRGLDGVTVELPLPNFALLNGKTATLDKGGIATPYTCPGGAVTQGGAGGDNGSFGKPGEPPMGDGGAGGNNPNCGNGGVGAAGNNGSNGKDGDGAATNGILTDVAWQAADGKPGEMGTVGQGGGGGIGFGGGGGGGGGAGGCGGAGGGAGLGGGSSIAVASFASTVRIVSSQLLAGAAGDGGNGVAGQLGMDRGGSAGNPVPDGCQGGKGGRAGNGGAGGGGAGGVSAGVIYVGTKPEVDPATESAIIIGAAGAAGTSPSGKSGAAGVAQKVLEIAR